MDERLLGDILNQNEVGSFQIFDTGVILREITRAAFEFFTGDFKFRLFVDRIENASPVAAVLGDSFSDQAKGFSIRLPASATDETVPWFQVEIESGCMQVGSILMPY